MPRTLTEVETKFLLPGPAALADVPAALARVCDRVRPAPTRVLHDTYLDTPDWWFFRAGLACRVRRQTEGRTTKVWLVLKELSRARLGDGVSSRMELEERLAKAPAGPIVALPAGGLGRRLRTLMGQRAIRVLFDIHNCRAVHHVRRGKLSAEIASDAVVLRAGRRTRELSEVELELQSGRGPKELAALSARLARRLRGRPAAASKYQMGLALAGRRPPSPPGRIGTLRLSPRQSTRSAAGAIIALMLEQVLWHEPGARLGLSNEPLHQMRVVTRRLRAALAMFRDALGCASARRLRDDLAKLGEALGAIRDLDVYIEYLGDAFESAGAIAGHRTRLEQQRRRLRARLVAQLDAPSHARLIARLRAAGRATRGRTAAARQDVLDFARRAIAKRHKRLLRQGRAILGGACEGPLHELRLGIKRLRYTCEFARSLFSRRLDRFIGRLVDMQDCLGRAQDSAVAAERLGQFARSLGGRGRPRRLIRRLSSIKSRHQRIVQAQRKAFSRLWSRFDQPRVRRELKSCLGK